MAAIASMIASASENGLIGRHGGRPWRNPADTERHMRLTLKRPLIIGRKTFAAMRFLPEIDLGGWDEIYVEHHDGGHGTVPGHTFTVFEKPSGHGPAAAAAGRGDR